MRRPLGFVSFGLLLTVLTATSLAAQKRGEARAPSPKATCLLNVLAAEGFRLSPPDSSRAEQLLTRTLTSVDVPTGMPDAGTTRVHLLEVRVDGARHGLVLERAFALHPRAGDQSPFAAESERLERDIRALLEDSEPRCAR